MKKKILIGLSILAVVLGLTNPSASDFKGSEIGSDGYKESNWLIFSTFGHHYSSINENYTDEYIGCLGNFFQYDTDIQPIKEKMWE